jgi:hypothetical protein
MATLQQFTTTQLIASLYDNPNAQTFPWNIQGIVGAPTRAQLLAELANRSGEQNVIVSGSASTKGTSVGSGTSSRTQIK